MGYGTFKMWDAVQKFNGKTVICFISKMGFGIGRLHVHMGLHPKVREGVFKIDLRICLQEYAIFSNEKSC